MPRQLTQPRLSVVDDFRFKLAEAMQKNGISKKELADRADIARQYVYRVLDGTQTPSLKIAGDLAEAAGLRITTAVK